VKVGWRSLGHERESRKGQKVRAGYVWAMHGRKKRPEREKKGIRVEPGSCGYRVRQSPLRGEGDERRGKGKRQALDWALHTGLWPGLSLPFPLLLTLIKCFSCYLSFI